MDQFWVFQEGELLGPYEAEALVRLPGFGAKMRVCRVGEDEWRLARDCQPIRRSVAPALLARAEWKDASPSPRHTVSSGDFSYAPDRPSLHPLGADRRLIRPARLPPVRSVFVPVPPPLPNRFRRRLLRTVFILALVLGLAWTRFVPSGSRREGPQGAVRGTRVSR